MAGGDQLHNGTVVGKLEGDRTATMAINDLLRDDFIPADKSRGIYFDQSWASMPAVFPVASGGIHVGHMPELVAIFGTDCVLRFGGGTQGHPQGQQGRRRRGSGRPGGGGPGPRRGPGPVRGGPADPGRGGPPVTGAPGRAGAVEGDQVRVRRSRSPRPGRRRAVTGTEDISMSSYLARPPGLRTRGRPRDGPKPLRLVLDRGCQATKARLLPGYAPGAPEVRQRPACPERSKRVFPVKSARDKART